MSVPDVKFACKLRALDALQSAKDELLQRFSASSPVAAADEQSVTLSPTPTPKLGQTNSLDTGLKSVYGRQTIESSEHLSGERTKYAENTSQDSFERASSAYRQLDHGIPHKSNATELVSGAYMPVGKQELAQALLPHVTGKPVSPLNLSRSNSYCFRNNSSQAFSEANAAESAERERLLIELLAEKDAQSEALHTLQQALWRCQRELLVLRAQARALNNRKSAEVTPITDVALDGPLVPKVHFDSVLKGLQSEVDRRKALEARLADLRQLIDSGKGCHNEVQWSKVFESQRNTSVELGLFHSHSEHSRQNLPSGYDDFSESDSEEPTESISVHITTQSSEVSAKKETLSIQQDTIKQVTSTGLNKHSNALEGIVNNGYRIADNNTQLKHEASDVLSDRLLVTEHNSISKTKQTMRSLTKFKQLPDGGRYDIDHNGVSAVYVHPQHGAWRQLEGGYFAPK
mmetsp:Transcript_6661/g.23542  ORF Transcript_6661/g.23542 Transcript_6661/m.23542 type:complete len:460 (+) Transcript_6661:48-1427(+)|eukprot:CAMPEP_0183795670 /NCGR_PEP_ID=MMETSP0803_2-20130417/5012_1 /TAXON_ID=195967 /ORGANISM="Crustomastix stigmata, Strain CCMP3273" /LENGTH=459 /DNA_ID=CAMNT_0026040135 /DNA_START=26 /DNA_END=1405 /DNA_ORIENTATION=+